MIEPSQFEFVGAIEQALLAYPGIAKASPLEIRLQAAFLARFAPASWEERYEDTTRGATRELERLSRAAAKLIKLLEQDTSAPTRRALESAGFRVPGEHGLDDLLDLLRCIDKAKHSHQENHGRAVKREAPRDTRALPLAMTTAKVVLKLGGQWPTYTTPVDTSFGQARSGPFIELVRNMFNILMIQSASVENAVVEVVKRLNKGEEIF